ncbi:MAG: hypothetical protein AAF889_04115 [Cyanobacteria bacterium P01_D01_bin.73]
MSIQPTSPRLPQSISVLTAIAVTTSITLWIVLWALAAVALAPIQETFIALGARLPSITEWVLQFHAWMLLRLGAIWSGLFYYGARRHWISQRQTKLLLIGTIILTWGLGIAVFLAAIIPNFFMLFEEIG